ncbi:MAG: hypothetical protein HYU26_04980 [Candidatus Rokubacteria bacterium]|nr:hypothetical protein [Candidatus Rokubacteria bacterium]
MSAPGGRFGRRLDLAVLAGAWAYLFLLHPPPGYLWEEFPWIVYNLLPLPLSLEGLKAAVRWQATVHTANHVRPVRAIEWWLAAKTLGCSPLAYFVANALAFGAAVWAATRVAWHVTGRRALAVFVGACLAVSYATAHSLLFFGFGLTTAVALGGLAAYFRGEELEGRGRHARWVLAFVLLLLGGLAHEIFLAFALVPLAHAVIVRRRRAAVVGAWPFAAIVPLYVLTGLVMDRVFQAGVSIIPPETAAIRFPLKVLVEVSARVGFTVASGGLPFDSLRVVPWVPEFARLREIAITPGGLATAAAVMAPSLALAGLALAAGAADPPARRRLGFAAAWLAFSSLPLLLPVTAPDAFHLTGALPPLFLIWTEALRARRGRALAAGLVAVVAWLGIHGAARWVLFHRDLPQMSRSVRALESVLAAAERRGEEAHVLFFPVQIGAHHGFMPTIQALYPTVAGRACAIGARVPGCLVEPVWIWSALAPAPPLPGACRVADGIRVGPLTPAVLRELDGSRRMLTSPTAGVGWSTDPAAVRAAGSQLITGCPLRGVERVTIGPDAYRLYRTESAPNARWYRFAFAPGPALLPVRDCEDGKPAGKS